MIGPDRGGSIADENVMMAWSAISTMVFSVVAFLQFYTIHRAIFVLPLSINIMKRILAIALVCTFTACRQKPAIENESIKPKKIEQANWLVGTWFSKSGERSNYERWNKSNDSTYVGRSYSIQHGDTVSAESVTLVQQGEAITYIPIVQGQNNNMPVMFTLVSSDSNKLIFENPAHDFPQIITYWRVPPDSLVAEISGMINGEHHAQKFPMRRVE